MISLYFREKGSAENVLEYGYRNIPDLLEGEVRVKMLASPINPADFMFIGKTYRQNLFIRKLRVLKGPVLLLVMVGSTTIQLIRW